MRTALAAALLLAVVGCHSSEPYYPDCAAARSASAAPLERGEPGYRPALDGDGDGVACDG